MVTPEFTIVVLPDTQYYSQDYPAVFDAQIQWVVDNKAALNIQMVLHCGDVVDDALTAQYDNADSSIGILDADGAVPYLLAIGNHDYNTVGTRSSTMFNTYFPQSRYTGQSWWNGGFYEAGKTENAYLLKTYGNYKFLFLSLEFGPRQAVLDWANNLMATYPDRLVFLVTHSFMYRDGTRCSTGDTYNPHSYIASDVHDGEEMWDEIKGNQNLFWLQNGHDINGTNVSVSARRTDTGTNGNTIRQVQANYQEWTNGGNGWLRILTFSPSAGTVSVTTYSPTLDAYLTGDAEQFSYSFPKELRKVVGVLRSGAGLLSSVSVSREVI